MTKVFINPGHSLGGKPDAGCCYNGLKESELAAQVADKVCQFLEFNGVTVECYQQYGEKLTANQQLNNVPKVANSSKADLFVSIHMNGFTNPDASGTETWYARGSVKGEKAAELVHKQLCETIGGYTLKNRGYKIDSRGLLVLKATIMPAILVEVGFISNKAEAQFIQSNITSIASRIAHGICQYFGIQYKTAMVPVQTKIELVSQDDSTYDCYVNGVLKLDNNKLTTCLTWINNNYA